MTKQALSSTATVFTYRSHKKLQKDSISKRYRIFTWMLIVSIIALPFIAPAVVNVSGYQHQKPHNTGHNSNGSRVNATAKGGIKTNNGANSGARHHISIDNSIHVNNGNQGGGGARFVGSGGDRKGNNRNNNNNNHNKKKKVVKKVIKKVVDIDKTITKDITIDKNINYNYNYSDCGCESDHEHPTHYQSQSQSQTVNINTD
jgi:hypothetical protein